MPKPDSPELSDLRGSLTTKTECKNTIIASTFGLRFAISNPAAVLLVTTSLLYQSVDTTVLVPSNVSYSKTILKRSAS